MSSTLPHPLRWNKSRRRAATARKKKNRRSRLQSVQRRLRLEPLEDRRVLSHDFGFAFGFGSASHEYGGHVATDSANNLYSAGSFQGIVDFDPGPGQR